MSEIVGFFAAITKGREMEAAYNLFCSDLEAALAKTYDVGDIEDANDAERCARLTQTHALTALTGKLALQDCLLVGE